MELQHFHSDLFSKPLTSTTIINNETGKKEFYFKGKEAALNLEYKNTNEAIKLHVFEEYKLKYSEINKGREFLALHPDTIFINESGLYQLILRSQKEKAIVFQKWIIEEVLPTLRKTGKYEINSIPQLLDNFNQLNYNIMKQNENFVEFKKEIKQINEKLKDPQNSERSRKGGLKVQENIRNMKKENIKLKNANEYFIFENDYLQKENKKLEIDNINFKNEHRELNCYIYKLESELEDMYNEMHDLQNELHVFKNFE